MLSILLRRDKCDPSLDSKLHHGCLVANKGSIPTSVQDFIGNVDVFRGYREDQAFHSRGFLKSHGARHVTPDWPVSVFFPRLLFFLFARASNPQIRLPALRLARRTARPCRKLPWP